MRRCWLLWDASADASITHWRYGKRKRPAKMEWTKVADGDVDSLEYEGRRIRYIRVENLTNGVEYLFRVRAKSAAAEGVLTDPVLVTPVQPQVAYGASSYEAREGGEPVPVEVALSAKATRGVSFPVTVTADAGTEAGDFTVAGLAEEMLSFALGDSTRSFTLTANEDSDGNDETVSLGFGDLPAGVSAGTPSSAQVTLLDVTVPRTVTYEFSRYEAIEGGAAKTVTVNMTPAAHRLLKIPITRTEVAPGNSDSYVRWIQPLYGRTGDMGKRRSFSAQFKAKVALEALVGDQTLAELAAKHHLHPNVIAQWKRQARESLPEVFARKTSSRAADHEAEVKALHGTRLRPTSYPWRRCGAGAPVSGAGDQRHRSSGGCVRLGGGGAVAGGGRSIHRFRP